MFGTRQTLARLSRGTAVAAAVIALCAPAAFAQPRFTTDTLAPGGSSSPGYHFITDTLAPGGGPTRVESYRFFTDTLAPGGGLVAAPSAAEGFDWSAAAVGAAVTAGLLLALVGGMRLLLHRRVVAV
jgi:hypothetical protein